MSAYFETLNAPSSAQSFQAGWEALLPPLANSSVLCLHDDVLAVASMAKRCAQVTALCPNAQAAQQLRQEAADGGWVNVSVVSLDDASALAALPQAGFDGAVLVDLMGTAQAGLQEGLEGLAQQMKPMLRNGAFVLVATPNRWGLSRGRVGQKFGGNQAWSWRGLRHLLRGAGTSHISVHPLLLNEYQCVDQVITAGGYRATKNAGLRREQLKQWLWGSRTANWWAPALAALGWVGGAARPSLADEVGARLATLGRTPYQLTQYLALISGKVIATYRATQGQRDARVVVITRDALTIARRTQEAESLRRLTALLPAHLASLLPAVLDRFTVDGCECFVLRHVPGVTADAVVPGLEDITTRAHGFLLELHRATRRHRVMDDAAWQAGIAPIFASAIKRNPVVTQDLQRLEDLMRAQVLDRDWVEVCSHGDFKIENVMYDPVSFALTGVIDWEHAMLEGLPYIDTAYLLTYNRMLRGQAWIDAASDMLACRFTPPERHLDEAYWAGTQLPARLIPVWRALVVVHHIGCRWHGDWSNQMADQLSRLLRQAAEALQPHPELASA